MFFKASSIFMHFKPENEYPIYNRGYNKQSIILMTGIYQFFLNKIDKQLFAGHQQAKWYNRIIVSAKARARLIDGGGVSGLAHKATRTLITSPPVYALHSSNSMESRPG